MTMYSIIRGERSGFAVQITDTGADGHIIEGFPSGQAAAAWLKGREEAGAWILQRCLSSNADARK